LGTLEQPQEPAPKWPPESLNLSLGEAEEEVADRVTTGKALQAQQGVQNTIRPQPLAVGQALCPDDDRHQKCRERVHQRDGVVGGSRFAKGRNRLGRFVQNQLGIAEQRGNFGAGRFVQGRVV
jgi:hypothetical protein